MAAVCLYFFLPLFSSLLVRETKNVTVHCPFGSACTAVPKPDVVL